MTETESTTPERLTRPSSEAMDVILGHPFPALDHGFVRVIDYMGDEAAIVQAARVSYGKGTKAVSEDRGLLRYLMRHRHTTPFEMCEIKLHLKMPVFVARQWVRHRTASMNEYSARYSVLAREFYVPSGADLAPQSGTNRQGREGGYSDGDVNVLRSLIEEACTHGFDVYDTLIDETEGGLALARELGRIVLPLSTYTEFYWKIDLHNLIHFLSLRMDPHAQKEIRDYAKIIGEMIEAWMPNVWEAVQDYVLEARTFSRQEMLALKALLIGQTGFIPEANAFFDAMKALSKREKDSFIADLELDEEDIYGQR